MDERYRRGRSATSRDAQGIRVQKAVAILLREPSPEIPLRAQRGSQDSRRAEGQVPQAAAA